MNREANPLGALLLFILESLHISSTHLRDTKKSIEIERIETLNQKLNHLQESLFEILYPGELGSLEIQLTQNEK